MSKSTPQFVFNATDCRQTPNYSKQLYFMVKMISKKNKKERLKRWKKENESTCHL